MAGESVHQGRTGSQELNLSWPGKGSNVTYWNAVVVDGTSNMKNCPSASKEGKKEANKNAHMLHFLQMNQVREVIRKYDHVRIDQK